MPSEIFHTNFTGIDWAIVVVYLLGSVAIGVYANRYIGNITDFIVAGRGIKVFLAVATMTGTELGLVTVMYNAEQGFKSGFAAYHIGVFWGLGMLTVGLTGFMIYRLRALQVMTIPEYYEQRFGRTTRVLGGTILALAGILNMGLFLQAGSQFVTTVLGLGPGLGLKLVMTSMLVLVLIYTTLGGMVSVVITDLIQFCVLGLGICVATGVAVWAVGWDRMVNTVEAHYGLKGFDPMQAQHYGWQYLVWMLFMGVAAGALWQTATLRALSAKSPAVAKKLYSWSSISFLARVVLPMTWGIAALAYISSKPALSTAFFPAQGEGLAAIYAMPLLFAQVLPSGLLGILTAGMLAAFMSTHDSYLLAWSAVITQDIIAPLRRRPLTDRQRIFFTRAFIVIIGLFLLVWGLWYQAPTSLWNYMAVTGTVYLAGAFTCVAFGLYWKRASRFGAIMALEAGLFSLMGVVPPLLGFKNWEEAGVSWLTDQNIAIMTIGLSLAGMVLGSLLVPDSMPREQRVAAWSGVHAAGAAAVFGTLIILKFGWFGLWHAVLIVTIAVFVGLVVVCGVMGWVDLGSLFRQLSEDRTVEPDEITPEHWRELQEEEGPDDESE